MYVVFAAIWAFGGALVEKDGVDYRRRFDKWWKGTWTTVKMPGALGRRRGLRAAGVMRGFACCTRLAWEVRAHPHKHAPCQAWRGPSNEGSPPPPPASPPPPTHAPPPDLRPQARGRCTTTTSAPRPPSLCPGQSWSAMSRTTARPRRWARCLCPRLRPPACASSWTSWCAHALAPGVGRGSVWGRAVSCGGLDLRTRVRGRCSRWSERWVAWPRLTPRRPRAPWSSPGGPAQAHHVCGRRWRRQDAADQGQAGGASRGGHVAGHRVQLLHGRHLLPKGAPGMPWARQGHEHQAAGVGPGCPCLRACLHPVRARRISPLPRAAPHPARSWKARWRRRRV